MTEQQRTELETILGYHFKNPMLLEQAFTRSSYVNEQAQGGHPARTQSNEVLEFLGDSVLSAALAYLLVNRYGEVNDRGLTTKLAEEDFTIIKSNMSDKRALAAAIRRLGVNRYLKISRGDRNQNVLEQDSPNEDLFESIIAAVALDCGMDFSVLIETVKRLDDIDRLLTVSGDRAHAQKNPKSAVKEWCEGKHIPYTYELIASEGPDHARIFTVRLTVSGYPSVTGSGTSKPKAEMSAAAAFLAMKEQK